ncbi:MAG TPA: NAD-dependent epimerase [Gemmatimonadaceae bacterium]|nr:NAD-dependent epimerase [Gemmatimonadaceae bacterium]
MTTLVTGAAGFIGFHVAKRLLEAGDAVVGIDNLNDYYDPSLKLARLAELAPSSSFRFVRGDICDAPLLAKIMAEHRPDVVINLAAQAGVRYSLENPGAYADSNLVGFLNILEACRHARVSHLVHASSSSVYGANTATPFSVEQRVDHPVSLYAATKKASELMAHSYAHLFRLPITALRFFTVYGPFGRPDMAYFKFTRAIVEGRPIELYNNGDMLRDFTYIDDVVEGVVRVAARPATPDPHWSGDSPSPATSSAPYRVYNIGHSDPVPLLEFVEVLERQLGIRAKRKYLPMQPGDVLATYADVSDLERDVGYRPETSIAVGLERFVDWYRDYYGVGQAAVLV